MTVQSSLGLDSDEVVSPASLAAAVEDVAGVLAAGQVASFSTESRAIANTPASTSTFMSNSPSSEGSEDPTFPVCINLAAI